MSGQIPLIKIKIVAVYHCNEIKQALNPLPSETKIFSITWMHTSYVPRVEKVDCQHRNKKSYQLKHPELALIDFLQGQAQTKKWLLAACVISLSKGEILRFKVKI